MRQKPQRWGAAVPVPEEQQQSKRQALIREAGMAFSTLGYHNASLGDVAKALHVTKTALYYYVKDKNEILFECFNLALDIADQAMADARSRDEKAIDRLPDFIVRYIQVTNSELGNFAVVWEPLTSLNAPEREKIQKRKRAFDAKLRKWVAQAIADGDVIDEPPALIVSFLMGAIMHVRKWYEPEGPLSADEIGQRFSRLVLSGICADKSRKANSRQQD